MKNTMIIFILNNYIHSRPIIYMPDTNPDRNPNHNLKYFVRRYFRSFCATSGSANMSRSSDLLLDLSGGQGFVIRWSGGHVSVSAATRVRDQALDVSLRGSVHPCYRAKLDYNSCYIFLLYK
ncbi:hypothetical protein NP493_21g05019 [Ridgeia piscesae]|uniref:Uncharacterized protein n=1 Tax=Ridgeia piscesae TaxID=27915 RepID=A0AAD9PDU3_RIDPI|nr:hypothetical protein NP493_21g05019 [Ridgeia piscesae]